MRSTARLFAAGLIVTAVAGGQSPAGSSPDKPAIQPEVTRPQPDANRPSQANQRTEEQDQQQKKANIEAAGTERRKELTDETARLLKLANELKAEVDKTDKDTLSIAVIKKAEEIERLARILKDKMKLTVAAN